jgi:hypothetical protein
MVRATNIVVAMRETTSHGTIQLSFVRNARAAKQFSMAKPGASGS